MRSMASMRTLIALVGYALGGLALYRGLPEQVPPAWTFSSGRTLWLGAPMIAFLLPTAAIVSDFLLRDLCVKDPFDEPNSASGIAVYDAIMLRVTVFMMGVHAAVLLAVLGWLSERSWTAVLIPLMLGFTMISVGNLLPKTRPNLAIGIRTRHTLSDRALWVLVHRWAGYLTVTGGAIIVLSAIALPRPVGPGMILLLAPAALAAACLLLHFSKPHVHA